MQAQLPAPSGKPQPLEALLRLVQQQGGGSRAGSWPHMPSTYGVRGELGSAHSPHAAQQWQARCEGSPEPRAVQERKENGRPEA